MDIVSYQNMGLAELLETAELARQAAERSASHYMTGPDGQSALFVQDRVDAQTHGTADDLRRCLVWWIERFHRIAEHPGERPTPFVSQSQTKHVLANAQTYLSRMTPAQVAAYSELRAAGDDRACARFLVDAEAARAGMNPQGLVVGQPPSLIPEARRIIRQLRQQGFSLAVRDGSIEVSPPGLSAAQREELSRLSAIVAAELGEVESIKIIKR